MKATIASVALLLSLATIIVNAGPVNLVDQDPFNVAAIQFQDDAAAVEERGDVLFEHTAAGELTLSEGTLSVLGRLQMDGNVYLPGSTVTVNAQLAEIGQYWHSTYGFGVATVYGGPQVYTCVVNTSVPWHLYNKVSNIDAVQNLTTTRWRLMGGPTMRRLFELEGQFQTRFTGEGYVVFRFFDVTNNAWIGSTLFSRPYRNVATAWLDTGMTDRGPAGNLVAFVTVQPGAYVDIELRVKEISTSPAPTAATLNYEDPMSWVAIRLL